MAKPEAWILGSENGTGLTLGLQSSDRVIGFPGIGGLLVMTGICLRMCRAGIQMRCRPRHLLYPPRPSALEASRGELLISSVSHGPGIH